MARKMDSRARELVIAKIQENGFASTDEIVAFVEPLYDFDPRAARRREIRRWVGQLARNQRDAQGARSMFLEKKNSEVIDIDVCKDAERVALVRDQLKIQSVGIWRSYKKSEKRRCELNGQTSVFDEMALLMGLNKAQ